MQKVIQVLTMLPALVAAVRTAEEAIPLPQAGRDKLDLVLGVVDDVLGSAEELRPVLARVIARIVGTFNRLGLFRSSASA